MAAALPLLDPAEAHPVARAVARAPRVERLTPEQRAELDQQMADIRAGRARLVSQADVPRVIEEMRRQERE